MNIPQKKHDLHINQYGDSNCSKDSTREAKESNSFRSTQSCRMTIAAAALVFLSVGNNFCALLFRSHITYQQGIIEIRPGLQNISVWP